MQKLIQIEKVFVLLITHKLLNFIASFFDIAMLINVLFQ